MAQAHRRRQALLAGRLATERLNVIQRQMLALIRRTSGRAMSDLALPTAVDRTTLTGIVDRLVEHGLVERRAANHDRRQVRLELAARGRAASAVRVMEKLAPALVGEGLGGGRLRGATAWPRGARS